MAVVHTLPIWKTFSATSVMFLATMPLVVSSVEAEGEAAEAKEPVAKEVATCVLK